MVASFFLLLSLPFVAAKVHDVTVGAGGLTFTPEALSADPGDQVVFHFAAKNHTATQSSFASPCGPKDGGFDSGFQAVAANQTDNLPTFTITVNDTTPVWVYCKQAANTPAFHCGQGMVFAVNCPTDGSPNSFTNFKKAALAVGASLSAAATATTSPTATDDTASLVTATITLSQSTWTTTYSSYPGSPDATPAALDGTVHQVNVGANGLTFDPQEVAAQPRDVIQFTFHAPNHTVTQSTFASPCSPMTGGFNSGFHAVASDETNFPVWNLTINDTSPIWAFCAQTNPKVHCQAGMVFAVNPVDSSAKNFTAFKNSAANGTTTAAGTTSSNAAVSSIRFQGAGSVLAAILLFSFLAL